MNPVFRLPVALIRGILRTMGLAVTRLSAMDALPHDLSENERQWLLKARPLSLGTFHRLASMLDAIAYVQQARIPGAIVECGVWRGGNMVLAAEALLSQAPVERELFLYDTFQGMSAPTDEDKDYAGKSAAELLDGSAKGEGFWCAASLEDVKCNMTSTGYPEERIHYVEGMVEKTIPQKMPREIALLSLDTDWYESTLHELTHLFPLLRPGGVLIIDDYGHWQGARRAVDQYFQSQGLMPLLARIDYTCRMMVKAA